VTKLDTILLNGNNIAVVRPAPKAAALRCVALTLAPCAQLVPGGAPADA
jgi:hypothetical protein